MSPTPTISNKRPRPTSEAESAMPSASTKRPRPMTDSESDSVAPTTSNHGSRSKSESESLTPNTQRWFNFNGNAKAQLVVKDLWPDVDPASIKVTPMRGGSYNHVVSLQAGDNKYVLRIPKEIYDATQPIDITVDVAQLLFLKNHTNIPSAKLLTFKTKTDSPTGRPFMVQERVRGHCLHDVYHQYPHPTRCRIARDLGVLYSQLLSVKYHTAGRVVLPEGSSDLLSTVLVDPFPHLYPEPWKVRETGNGRAYTANADTPSEPIQDFLQAVIRTQSDACPSDDNERLYGKYRAMVEDLGNCYGFFENVSYSFCHLDLYPRNIMFNPDAKDDESSLTVLDWDSALIVPSFMVGEPPSWLWDAYVHVEGVDANPGPTTDDGRELQQIFEDAAGPEYKRYSDSRPYRLARRMCREILLNGVGSPFGEKRVGCLLTVEDWDKFWPTLH